MEKFIKSFVYAWNGIVHSLKERAVKSHFFVAILVLILGTYFDITITEWIFVILGISTIIALEMVNTAIEHLVNIVRDEAGVPYEKIGHPKDIAAGAVLFASIGILIIGLIIFLPYIL